MIKNNFFKLTYWILLFFLFFSCQNKNVQNFTVSITSYIDTTFTTIGSPVNYSFIVSKPQDKILKIAPLEFSDVLDIDSIGIEINDQSIEKKYQVVFWDTGSFSLPTLFVNVFSEDSVYEYGMSSDSLRINVISIKSKEPGLTSISKGDILPIKEPVIIKNFPFVVFISLLILFILFLLILGILKKRQKNILEQNNTNKIFDHPAIIALRKLKKIEIESFSSKNKIKEFYIDISYIIREFLENNYYVKALEMTTKEIKDNKKLFAGHDNDELFDVFFIILHSADMVKYAKQSKKYNNCIDHLNSTINIINNIYSKIEIEKNN